MLTKEVLSVELEKAVKLRSDILHFMETGKGTDPTGNGFNSYRDRNKLTEIFNDNARRITEIKNALGVHQIGGY